MGSACCLPIESTTNDSPTNQHSTILSAFNVQGRHGKSRHSTSELNTLPPHGVMKKSRKSVCFPDLEVGDAEKKNAMDRWRWCSMRWRSSARRSTRTFSGNLSDHRVSSHASQSSSRNNSSSTTRPSRPMSCVTLLIVLVFFLLFLVLTIILILLVLIMALQFLLLFLVLGVYL